MRADNDPDLQKVEGVVPIGSVHSPRFQNSFVRRHLSIAPPRGGGKITRILK